MRRTTLSKLGLAGGASEGIRRPLSLRGPSFERLEQREVLSLYFVSPSGTDTASGTSASPWRTLQQAANAVRAGDTVTVRAGNYAGFDLRTDGTAAAPITFRAEPGAAITSRNARTPDGINLEGADYVTIEGFRVAGMPRAGIRAVQNKHVTIRGNVADANTSWGIFSGFSDDLTIEGNTASRTKVQHGIYVSNSGDRPVIRDNVIWGNYTAGIHMNGDKSEGGDGIISGALVEGNVIYGNGRGGASGINADGVEYSTFRNNLLYGNHASGISLYRNDGGGESKGNVVVNNTVVMASDARWALNIQYASTNTTVSNNIFYNASAKNGTIDLSPKSLPGLVSDYNVVIDRFTLTGGSTKLTLGQWRSQTGQDMHSIVSTPAALFANPSAGDYRLKASSPAIDAGRAQGAPATDLSGAPRPRGLGFDIGAYEYQLIINTPPVAAPDSAMTTEGAPVTIGVLANDTDRDGDRLAVAAVAQPANGSVAITANGAVVYTPKVGYSGIDTFVYTATDGRGGTAKGTVTVTVDGAAATAEWIVDDGGPDYSESGLGWSAWVGADGTSGLGGDMRQDSSGYGAGSATWSVTGLESGNYEVFATWVKRSYWANDAPYTVFAGGRAQKTMRIDQRADPSGESTDGVKWQSLGAYEIKGGTLSVRLDNDTDEPVAADAIRIVRRPPILNQSPTAVVDKATTTAGFSVTIGVLANDADADGDRLTVTAVAQPSGGTAALNPDGTVSYTPRAGFLGVDRFSYATSDGRGGTARGEVSVTVSAATEWVVDNGGAGYSEGGRAWSRWVAAKGDRGHGGEMRQSHSRRYGLSTATWSVLGLASGTYEVYATWVPRTYWATDSPFTVLEGSRSLGTRRVNQRLSPSGSPSGGRAWTSLGMYTIGGGALSVVLSNDSSGQVAADAIRVVRRGTSPVGLG